MISPLNLIPLNHIKYIGYALKNYIQKTLHTKDKPYKLTTFEHNLKKFQKNDWYQGRGFFGLP